MAQRLTISPTGDYFLADGVPFFLTGDTVWMAFQKLSLEEWEYVVRRRYEQGFTALQISVLPVTHDNAAGENDLHPFAMRDGRYVFSEINTAYFEKAQKMLAVVRQFGMIPFLHLFWVNYIPDTWAAKKSPATVIPFEQIEPLTAFFVKTFASYNPIYSVSGDTSFESEQVVRYYLHILDVLHRLAPHSLTTFHLQPGADPPEVLRRHPQYHFYCYQSGHSVYATGCDGERSDLLGLSAQFLGKQEKKPIVNSEPCYEGHGHGNHYGRFGVYDVRRAIWLSLLSGAKAGISYGAHGMWQMYRRGEVFNNVPFSGQPYDWRDALQFPGAWEIGFAKWLMEREGLFSLTPSQAVRARSPLVRLAEGEGILALYLPYADQVTVLRDLRRYRCDLIMLGSRRFLKPALDCTERESTLELTGCNEDCLLIARMK